MLSHHLFQTIPPQKCDREHTKPLFIQAGADAFSKIGEPKVKTINKLIR